MNISMKEMTIPKMAGVWQTAEPMSMLVVNWGATWGCRPIPSQQAPAGIPAPTDR